MSAIISDSICLYTSRKRSISVEDDDDIMAAYYLRFKLVDEDAESLAWTEVHRFVIVCRMKDRPLE